MWLLTVSEMPLVSPSGYFHVSTPYFEGITICWGLLPWILLKVLCLIFLPSIFCLCLTLLWSQQLSPLLHFVKYPLPHPIDVLGGLGVPLKTWAFSQSGKWHQSEWEGGKPCLVPHHPQQLPAADALGEGCGNKSNLQLWLYSSSVWQSAV